MRRIAYGSRAWSLLWGGAALFVVTGCGRPEVSHERIVPRVTVAPVRAAEQGASLRLSGTIQAERTIPVGFPLPGTVAAVLVHEGERVQAGQVLARLEGSAQRDALGMAQAKAAQAEDAYARLEPMHKNQTVPEIQWVEVKTGREQARHALSIAKKNLDDAVLRAPEAAIVSRRHLEPGMSAIPGSPAVTLVQTGKVFAVAPIAETRIAEIRLGQPATIRVGALDKTIEGRVVEIGVIADPLTRTYPVKVELENTAGELRVGMVAEVRMALPREGRALAVPPEAVRVDEQGAPYVYVLAEGEIARRRPVTLVGFVSAGTAISGEIQEGERVVTSGTSLLSNGLPVRVAESSLSRGEP